MIGRMRAAVRGRQAEGAYEPVAKRVRAMLDGATVVDTTGSVLIWPPGRVVPSYAVPEADIAGDVVPDEREPSGGEGIPSPRSVVDSVPGERVLVRAPGGSSAADGLRLAEPELAGLVLVDFAGFDAWMEEDEMIVGHPRDPFHRIDILRASRHVRVELGGELLAESHRPRLLFETGLPMRLYLPRDDVRADLLVPSGARTVCAYKGEASYWSVEGAGDAGADLVWSYEAPLREADEVTGLMAAFNERVDLIVDGVLHERPNTPWSPTWDGRML